MPQQKYERALDDLLLTLNAAIALTPDHPGTDKEIKTGNSIGLEVHRKLFKQSNKLILLLVECSIFSTLWI